MHHRRRALSVCCSLVLVVANGRAQSDSTRAAEAATSQRALAEVLFRQGRDLMEQGQVAEACDKFTESLRLDMALGTSLNLAVCFETQGRLASAWSEYNRAAGIARRSGDAARAEFAQQASTRLEGLLATLRVTLSPEAQRVKDLKLELDGRELGSATLDTPIPLDAGAHVMVAKAAHHQPWLVEIRATTETPAIALTVPGLLRSPAPAASPMPVLPPNHATAVAPKQDRASDGHTQRWLGLATGGAGLAAIAVGSVFGVRALMKKGERDDTCDADGCSPAGIEAHRDAQHAASAANVAFATGGVLLVAGGLVYFTAPDAASASRQAPLSFAASPDGLYLSMQRPW